MGIAFGGTVVEVTIYMLCVITSLLCAWLLARANQRGRTRLLVWSALCFAFLAVNNLVLAVDVLLLPDVDLSILQLLTSLAAVMVLLYAFVWELPYYLFVKTFLAGMVTAGFLAAGSGPTSHDLGTQP